MAPARRPYPARGDPPARPPRAPAQFPRADPARRAAQIPVTHPDLPQPPDEESSGSSTPGLVEYEEESKSDGDYVPESSRSGGTPPEPVRMSNPDDVASVTGSGTTHPTN